MVSQKEQLVSSTGQLKTNFTHLIRNVCFINSRSALSAAQQKTQVHFKLASFKADELNMGQFDIAEIL